MISIFRSSAGTAVGTPAPPVALAVPPAAATGAVAGVAGFGVFCAAQRTTASASTQHVQKELLNKKDRLLRTKPVTNRIPLPLSQFAVSPVTYSLLPILCPSQNKLIRCAKSPTFENPAKFTL